jgi:hypothetical protein
MGVKLLNTFLKKQKLQRKWCMRCLYGKKIVIDTNNYIYEFLSGDNLINGFIDMCELFLKYKIIALFIFDGKPTNEKLEDIKKRKNDREKSKHIYNKNINKLSKQEKKELMRKIVRVTKNETELVKSILKYYNMKWLDSPNESDELCCKLVGTKKIYGCLSNDMDMLVYGCKYVFRNLDLYNETIDVYNIDEILYKLKMSLDSFKYMCLFSNKKENIFNTYKYYNIYTNVNNNNTFLEYLLDKKRISNDEFIIIKNSYKFYNLHTSTVLNKCPYLLLKTPKRIFSVNFIRLKMKNLLGKVDHSSQSEVTCIFGG